MTMSTMVSGKRQQGGLVNAAAMTAGSLVVGAATKAIGLIASVIAHRAERRLMRELYALDHRLLDDIGIDRGRLSVRPHHFEAN
jgi:uncharacterized protein YjiS (DUF1127 family)